VKRHPGLASLSRDHHHALVFARQARQWLSEATPAERIAELRRRFDTELAPHFAVEEHELVGRTLAGPEPLASLAAHVVADHDALRAMLASLQPVSLGSQCEAFGARLEEHVRFEEREWFPALEEHLGGDALTRLAAVLRPAPPSAVVGFRQDENGDFIAELGCGHAQHVRHRPPLESRPWVTSEAGRRAFLGTSLPCALCRMPKLPTDVAVYKQTAVFDAQSVPAGLKRSHTLKADTWGEIIVERGQVLYVLEDDGDMAIVLRPGVVGVVAPERPHHVELDHETRFYVRFLKRDAQHPRS
jgi:tellurite methyltransferase